MWSWMSPKVCFVLTSPVPFATDIAPSFTSHFASPPDKVLHFDKSFPSKRTIASDGATPGLEPGVTFFGFKSQTSVTFGSNDSRGVVCEKHPIEINVNKKQK